MEQKMHFEHGSLPGSLELAYLGDTVYDLFIRRKLIQQGGKVRTLHAKAIRLVCAHAQSQAFLRIEETLTEEEAAVAKRARNAHQNPPKNADPAEYHRATAFEALIGYLYCMGREQRIQQLLEQAVIFE